jgi:transcriptional regulator with XRE-family HTH domain
VPVDPGISDDEPVGAALARLRRARGLTGASLAALVGMSQPKISRIEHGRGLTNPADVGALARALGAGEAEVSRLMERAEHSRDRLTDWRPTSTDLAARQTTMGDWESSTTQIREFQPAVVPGLLQTSGYAKAVLAGVQRLILNAPDPEPVILAAVAERMSRQQLLGDPTKSFRFLITESVLRTEICAPAEMLAQIHRLREAADRQPQVTIDVVPDAVPTELPPMHGFTMLDDSMVVLDIFNTGILTRNRKDVESYRRIFESFEANAVPPGPLLDKYENFFIDRLRARRS